MFLPFKLLNIAFNLSLISFYMCKVTIIILLYQIIGVK